MNKKGEIIIYAVSLMLVTAGYFNYAHFEENNIQETYVETNETINMANIGDAVLVSSNEVYEKNEEINNENYNSSYNDNVIEENNEIENDNKGIDDKTEINNNNEKYIDENETVDTSNTAVQSDDTSQYYANSKLEREKMYAEMISSYEEILNNSNSSEVQKNTAVSEITKINNSKNSIMIIENLITTKGFDNCVVFINNGEVEVVANAKTDGGLDTSKVAIIQNIVERELSVEADNIHITEK